MDRGRDPITQRGELAADIETIVESDTDTLVDAVSRDEIGSPELELLCQEADAGVVEIDDGVLSLVRIVTSLLTQRGERSEDTTS